MAKYEVSDDLRRQAFDYYSGHEKVPLGTIATFLGMSRGRLWHLRRKWSWPPRAEAIANALARTGTDGELPPRVSGNGLRQAAELLAAVTRSRLDTLIRDRTAEADIDHDRTARILAAYAKTLTIAQSLLEQEGADPHDKDGHDTDRHDTDGDLHHPRDIDELRDELARHLERIVAEEEAVGSDGILV